ncbi:MAG TPA: PPOX class F420-dependent oxidoreductase [Anaerolineaceae bacterium]
MKLMSESERREFLAGGRRTAKLATVREDGMPHVVPVWFVLDGDDLLFTTWHTTAKYRALQHDPRLALCVDDEEPPYAFVMMEGTATLEEHAPDLLEWATRIATRYMGADLGASYGKRNAVDGEILVRVRPTHFIAQKEIAS